MIAYYAKNEIETLQQMDYSCRERVLLAGVRVLVGGAAVLLSGEDASKPVIAHFWLHSTPAGNASVPLSLPPAVRTPVQRCALIHLLKACCLHSLTLALHAPLCRHATNTKCTWTWSVSPHTLVC